MKRLFWLLRFIRKTIRRIVGLALLLAFLQGSTYDTQSQWNRISYRTSAYHFDYIGWEIGALAAKVDQTLFGLHPFVDEETRSQFVRDYMTDLARAQSLEAQINTIYTDPAVKDPASATLSQRAERDTLRNSLRQRQSLVEGILEGQVAAVLVDEGFEIGGQLFPPMSMRFTEVPNLLIVSPRDQIRFDVSMNLYPLPVDEKAALENEIDAAHDVSSLIVPLGGIALYPAMIFETTSVQWAVETFAHEWLHHYLFFFPLGIHYFTSVDAFSSEARAINETAADLFGKEIGRLVLERYYPDLVPPPPPENPSPAPLQPPDPDAFSFGAAMHETRVTVDQLLSEGNVDEAEVYMEERRQLFVANGYPIRKLNQAYFAFYGGYQAGGIPGVAGEDPIGPAVKSIQQASPSLHDFVVILRGITTREELLQISGAMEAASAEP